jgi:hypothetical protein
MTHGTCAHGVCAHGADTQPLFTAGCTMPMLAYWLSALPLSSHHLHKYKCRHKSHNRNCVQTLFCTRHIDYRSYPACLHNVDVGAAAPHLRGRFTVISEPEHVRPWREIRWDNQGVDDRDGVRESPGAPTSVVDVAVNCFITRRCELWSSRVVTERQGVHGPRAVDRLGPFIEVRSVDGHPRAVAPQQPRLGSEWDGSALEALFREVVAQWAQAVLGETRERACVRG